MTMNKTFQYLAGAASIVLAYYALKDRGFFNAGQSGLAPGVRPVPDTDPVDIWPGLDSGVF
ncbi:MAG: hypothetical protein AB2758_20730 [Candidatus Thiodiazotropha endolucinida]